MCKYNSTLTFYRKGASKRGANFGALDKDWDSLKIFINFYICIHNNSADFIFISK